MDATTTSGPRHIVGREAELAVLDEFLETNPPSRALVLTGGAGIGKTTLWEAGVGGARERGMSVLVARPVESETQLSLAGLADLLTEVDEGVIARLPPPQADALAVALLRAKPKARPPAPRTIATAFLGVIRELARSERVLVAVDDVQWLDSASAEALAFAARRLAEDPVCFLLARRAGSSSAFEQALHRAGIERIEVGPLTLGATRRMLSEQLGLSLPRWMLRRIVESTDGNPLFALEVARTLAERERPRMGDELPIPDAVDDLLGIRVAGLPTAQRRLLLALALAGDLSAPQIGAIASHGVLDDAVATGVVLRDSGHIRPAHPLLAAAARAHASEAERQEAHRALADAVTDPGRQARHLAFAADAPDAEVAAAVSAAAAEASARGVRQEAVELAGHALHLTPPGSPERTDRVLALADSLALAGERGRLTDFLTSELDLLPPGPARGRAYLLLADGLKENNDELRRYLEQALAESRNEPELRAAVLAEMSVMAAVVGVERIVDAEAWALEAVADAPRSEPEAALQALAWARALRGVAFEVVHERIGTAADPAYSIWSSIDRVAGVRHAWRGEVDEARAALTQLSTLADERGEELSYAALRLHLCELALRAGDWEEASQILDEWRASTGPELLMAPAYERCRALLEAGRGAADEAHRWAAEAIARAEETGVRWDRLEALRARGIAALLLHDPATAAASLREVWDHARREGVEEPGVFPVGPDLVEALIELGEFAEARSVTARLGALAERQEHPWARAAARQCEAAVRLAAGEDDAAAELEQAAATLQELGLRFDYARALLLLGRLHRRRRKWAAARRALEQAAAAFDEIDSPGWAEEARSELARIGGRRPAAAGELTPTERQVAELAVDGLSNKEIAQTLHVSVHTVEVHLSNVYAKLGVRSRSRLVGALPRT
jgi:DNA-binding CsgD family transcriptional regulator/tetratricopeptide (TPR) repeat protein